MDNVPLNRRTDHELEAILLDTGDWAVNGPQGRVLGFAGTLRRAVERAADYAASGAIVTALCRLPSDNIVVLPNQINRLRQIVAVREFVPLPDAEVWAKNLTPQAARPPGVQMV